MRSSFITLTLVLVVVAVVSGESATAGEYSGNETIKLLNGGGRIWEGDHVSRPTADITFSGQIRKIGPGDTTMDFRCNWSIHFKDVAGTELDGARFHAKECRSLTLRAAGGDPDVSMRVVLLGDLNGVPGFSVVLIAVDETEPGFGDQIRLRLFRGEAVIGDTNPRDLLYDTRTEFTGATGGAGSANRTFLDSGNLQSKVESTDL